MNDDEVASQNREQEALYATIRRVQQQDRPRHRVRTGHEPGLRTVRCRHCGSLMMPSDVSCSACGARSTGFVLFGGAWSIGKLACLLLLVLLVGLACGFLDSWLRETLTRLSDTLHGH
jgi:hypothetical protein